MAQASRARFADFEDEIGTPFHFNQIGYLAISTNSISEHLEAQARLQQSLGVRTEIPSPRDILSLFPELNIEDISLGAWGPDDGILDPHS